MAEPSAHAEQMPNACLYSTTDDSFSACVEGVILHDGILKSTGRTDQPQQA